MIGKRTAALLALLLCAILLPVSAQEEENLDDLFDDPVMDTVVEDPETDHLSQFVSADKVVITGSFSATGGGAAGWTDWPDFADLSAGFDGTIGLSSGATLVLDARPDPDFHLHGTMSTSIDPINGTYSWTPFSLGELFIDYTWLGNVFIRMGKHGMSWGQSRFFSGATNLVADAAGGFALRASVPTLLDGIQAIALLQSGYFQSGLQASYKQICYALKADAVVFDTLLSLGGRYQVAEGYKALLSVKKVLFGVDLLTDVVVHYDLTAFHPKVVAGFFREWQDFKAYGEYQFDGSSGTCTDQSMGLALGYNNVGGSPIDLGAKWMHAFIDNSGSVTVGATWSPWKFISAKVGLPVVYGAEGSRYRLANGDPGGRRILLALGLEMSVSF